jgi:hypothetical protein
VNLQPFPSGFILFFISAVFYHDICNRVSWSTMQRRLRLRIILSRILRLWIMMQNPKNYKKLFRIRQGLVGRIQRMANYLILWETECVLLFFNFVMHLHCNIQMFKCRCRICSVRTYKNEQFFCFFLYRYGLKFETWLKENNTVNSIN